MLLLAVPATAATCAKSFSIFTTSTNVCAAKPELTDSPTRNGCRANSHDAGRRGCALPACCHTQRTLLDECSREATARGGELFLRTIGSKATEFDVHFTEAPECFFAEGSAP
jgi:hypothetical protein